MSGCLVFWLGPTLSHSCFSTHCQQLVKNVEEMSFVSFKEIETSGGRVGGVSSWHIQIEAVKGDLRSLNEVCIKLIGHTCLA